MRNEGSTVMMQFVRQKKDYTDYDMTVLDGLISYVAGSLGTILVFLVFFGSWPVAALAAIPAGFLSLRICRSRLYYK